MFKENKISQMLFSAIIIYVGICCFLYVMQRKILYVPSGSVSNPKEIGLKEYQDISLRTDDGEILRAWYYENPKASDVILYFHGNAANLENRREKYQAFAKSKYSVLAITYRGYPGSTGKPTEPGLYLDGEAAIKYLKSQGYKDDSIILYGESLGTGVATEMATRFDAKALVLESPFTSITDVAKAQYWFVPVSLLLKDHYDSKAKIKTLKIPVLIFHGKKDKVVPAKLGIELAKSYSGASLILTETEGHMDFSGEFLIRNVEKFIDSNTK